jgi:hypothetical protein
VTETAATTGTNAARKIVKRPPLQGFDGVVTVGNTVLTSSDLVITIDDVVLESGDVKIAVLHLMACAQED